MMMYSIFIFGINQYTYVTDKPKKRANCFTLHVRYFAETLKTITNPSLLLLSSMRLALKNRNHVFSTTKPPK